MPWNVVIIAFAMAVSGGIAYISGSDILVAAISGGIGGMIGVTLGSR